MFKMEKVVCSGEFKVDKSGLWDFRPSPAGNGKHQRDFIELSVFIAVQHLKGACLLPTAPLVLFN